jgi:hypothetical protein
MSRDPRIDAYIARQQDFARPILKRIRAALHSALPDVEEGIRWGMPAFLWKGRPLANMAAFKAHATFGFWRGGEIVGARAGHKAMGQFGRMTTVEDLPSDEEFRDLIRKAAALAEEGPAPRANKAPKPELPVPDDLAAALAAKPPAAENFAKFSPSARLEYVEWVVASKRLETRRRRIDQAAEWISEGKRRNWKYEKKG